MAKRKDYYFPVECGSCKKIFDFGDYLTTEDEGKHIAEIILEKCGGDFLICDKCLKEKKVLDRGTFQWIISENAMIPQLELISENGIRKILNVRQFDDDSIALVINKRDVL